MRKITKNIKNIKQNPKYVEVIAGITTFFTMAYIIVVNPSMLSSGTGMPFSGVLTATVLLAFSMTMLMGLYAKLPFAVAPGMGINAFFTYSLVLGQKVPWQTALGIIFWAGLLFWIMSVTPIRVAITRAVPPTLRIGAAVGIGLFLTFIGLKNAGVVVADPSTFVKLGPMNKQVLLCFLGIGVAIFFTNRKNPFAFLISIFLVTCIALALGMVHMPENIFSAPDFKSVAMKADLKGALHLAFLPALIAFVFTGLFDSLSSFVGVSQAAGMVDRNGQPHRLREGLIVDSVATMSAALLGTSSGTVFIESSAGIEVGGRTGLTAVVTALCFLPCLFLAPLAGVVPSYATAPVLIIVGCYMFRSISGLTATKLEELFPAFLTIILMPLTFSITQGILWGFIAHVVLHVLSGRAKEVHPILYIISGAWIALHVSQAL